MKHYLASSEQVLQDVNSTAQGLTQQEGQKRLEQNGPNKLKEGKKTSVFMRFIKQLIDPMVIILIAAAVVSAVTAALQQESFAEVFIIMAVVIINAVLGVVQETKAEQAIEALQKMTEATSKVYRDGKLTTIHSQDIVVGDVIVLEAGDSVPADARIIECASLKVEEAALTGESVPSTKTADALSSTTDIPLGDRKNMVYMGSTVVYGRAVAVVVACGMDTEMGKIADVLAQAKAEQTPLQRKMAKLSKLLSFVVIGICLFIFGFKLIKDCLIDGQPIGDIVLPSFMIAISLAVAAIPEGLAMVVTIVLSIGVTNMSKKNAVIRKMTAVETLGCAQIICSDKTGTLTQNKMTVVENVTADPKLLAKAMAQCSDATLNDQNQAIGEPTECALVNWAYTLELNKTQLSTAEKRVAEAPFDSMRKMMSTIHKTDNGYVQYTKGAPDEILKRCTKILLQSGEVVQLTDKHRQDVLQSNKDMADRALRVLACAYKPLDSVPTSVEPNDIENQLIYIGMVGMIDPVRPEVKDAIVQCKQAGIRPIMITGDHIDTAIAIAMELGIITDKSQAITGAEMAQMSDEEFEKNIVNYSVYARVQPEHKVRIVTTWKKLGMVTAMTGDGVNDAPSIKSADIGIGMGITGTDVTKNAADMVLRDDNFATIVSAVGEGRRIYDNIRKSIQFLLSSNLAEVIAIFIATIIGFTLLEPVHLLWINLITDTFPALALGLEKPESDIMKRKPRPSNEGIFANGLALNVVLHGLFVALITLSAYLVGNYMYNTSIFATSHNVHAMTMAFFALSMAEIIHAFNVRSQTKSVFTLKQQNKFMWIAMACSLALSSLIVFVPALANLFSLTPLTIEEYFITIALALIILPLVEIQKLIANAVNKAKANKK